MRCDHPMGYDEDFLEPACDIFLQLFLLNAQLAGNEDFIPGNEAVVIADLGSDNEYESDDNFSFPSLHTISETSFSFGESSGDEGEVEIEAVTVTYQCEESDIQEFLTENSINEESCECIDFELEIIHHSPNSQSDSSLLTINNQNAENTNISNVGFQETDGSFTPSNEPPISEESSLQTDTLPNNNNNISSTSTYVAVYVVVPPTSFSNESDNLLTEVPSDRLINSQSPSLLGSDNRNIPLENESLYTVNKICDNSEKLILDGAAVCSSFSVTERDIKCHSLSELHSELDIENGVSSDSKSENIVFDDNLHPKSVTTGADLSDEININQDENASCDVISDNSMSNLKRKVANSVDEDLINKVPKYSVSHESSESQSVSEVSLGSFCKELSSDAMPVLCEEDNINIAPSIVNVENVTLPLGRVVEDNSITEQQTDL